MKKIYIIAGEASGDLHGAHLIKALQAQNNQLNIRGWGGNLMQQAGCTLVKHYRDLAFMGFLEVLLNLKTILKNLKFCKADVINFNPDFVVLIDYPGFNMRIAEFAKKQGFKVFYYIPPQVWAWNKKRVFKINKYVDKVFSVLPFEHEFYQKYGVNSQYVGHPLLDAVNAFNSSNNLSNNIVKQYVKKNNNILLLVPGSRKQEIKVMLPVMLAAAKKFENYTVIIAGAPSIQETFYNKIIAKTNQQVQLVFEKTYALMQQATIAAVTSGTATLETALFSCPQVVCYKGNSISYLIAKQLIKIKYISLVNLILDRQVVKELIQNEFNAQNLYTQLSLIEIGKPHRQAMQEAYKKLINILENGGASQLVAKQLLIS